MVSCNHRRKKTFKNTNHTIRRITMKTMMNNTIAKRTRKILAVSLTALVMTGTFAPMISAEETAPNVIDEITTIADVAAVEEAVTAIGTQDAAENSPENEALLFEQAPENTEALEPNAPTAEETAQMREESNKKAILENKYRELQNQIRELEQSLTEVVPENPDAPTADEIAAIRELNNQKQTLREMKREYERLYFEIYGQELSPEETTTDPAPTEETLPTPTPGEEEPPVTPTEETPAPTTDETPEDNKNVTTEVQGDIVIITETITNDDGTTLVIRTMTNTVTCTTTTTIAKYDADGKLIIEEPENKETPTDVKDEPKTDDTTTDDNKDQKKSEDDSEEDSWLGSLVKDTLDKIVDKGIDKGLDWVFDNFLGGKDGDSGWMGIVKKLPWDQVCKTVCNVIDSSLGGDGSGNNGQYSMADIEKAFADAYARAEQNNGGAGKTVTTTETNGVYNTITIMKQNDDGTTTIIQIITNLETEKQTTRTTILDENGYPVPTDTAEEPKTAEESKAAVDVLTPKTVVENKTYSDANSRTTINSVKKIGEDGIVTITRETEQYFSDGGNVKKTVEITETRNADGTITTEVVEKTSSKIAKTVYGKVIGYTVSNNSWSNRFTETEEAYKARMEKEAAEEANYGMLDSFDSYELDVDGNRI